jgi:hypothetical protein
LNGFREAGQSGRRPSTAFTLPLDIFGRGRDQLDAGDHRPAILAGDLPGQELRAPPVEIGGIAERPIEELPFAWPDLS